MDKKKLLLFAEQCLVVKNVCILDATVLTPSNFSEEKGKFIQSKTYNPQFRYKKIPITSTDKSLRELHTQIKTINLPQDLGTYFLAYLNHLALVSKTIAAIGTEAFASLANQVFPSYTAAIPDALQTISKIEFYEEKKRTMHSAEGIAVIFHEYIQTYEALCDWKIHIDTFNDHTIRVQKKQLTIGSRVKRTTANVNRLIVHEIESHILQQHNMSLGNPLVNLLQFDEATLFSEGLAVFNEVSTKTITRKAYNTYLYRLQAVAMLNRSFREIYTYLTEFVTPHQAFIITARVKRGMTDTAQPGGFPKDAAYLLGYNKINHYVSRGGNIPFLYTFRHPEYGKLLEKYNLVTPSKYVLPKFLETV